MSVINFRKHIHAPQTSSHVNAFDFWVQKSSEWPCLSLIALSILSVPATSVSSRRLLDNLSSNNRINKELWKKALLVYNDHYISI
jgi:hypothetical protein